MAGLGDASASNVPSSVADELAAAEHAAQEAPRDVAARSRAGAAAFAAHRFGDAKRHFLAAAAVDAGLEPPALDTAAAAAAPIPTSPVPSTDLARWLRKCDAELSLAAGGSPIGVSPPPPRPTASALPAAVAAEPSAAAPARSAPAKRTPRDWSTLEKEVEAEEKASKLEGAKRSEAKLRPPLHVGAYCWKRAVFCRRRSAERAVQGLICPRRRRHSARHGEELH